MNTTISLPPTKRLRSLRHKSFTVATNVQVYCEKSSYKDDLTLMMIVEDQARQAVLCLPFFPGC